VLRFVCGSGAERGCCQLLVCHSLFSGCMSATAPHDHLNLRCRAFEANTAGSSVQGRYTSCVVDHSPEVLLHALCFCMGYACCCWKYLLLPLQPGSCRLAMMLEAECCCWLHSFCAVTVRTYSDALQLRVRLRVDLLHAHAANLLCLFGFLSEGLRFGLLLPRPRGGSWDPLTASGAADSAAQTA
jgi:hypothetical protein